MDEHETTPDQPPIPVGLLDRLIADDAAQKKLAVWCLAGFVLSAAAGGFAYGHVPVMVGCWVLAAALLLCAWAFGWEPAEQPETTIAYYEQPPVSGGPPLPGAQIPPPPAPVRRIR